MKLRLAVVVGAVALVLSNAARAAEPDPELVSAEKVLKDAGVAADGPGLLDYFRKQTLTPDQEKELQAAVKRLGDNDFETREKATAQLKQAGRMALPYLNKAAKDPDVEIARRAEMILEEIKLTPVATLMSAACRLLVVRRPAGAPEVLLAYLPNAADETVEEAVFQALASLGLRDGKPDAAITKALADANTLRRAAAASVVGRCPKKEDRAPAVKLLDDADARVRYEAANALLRSGDKAAMPTLIALLGDAPVALAWQVEEVLFRLAGDQENPPSLGSGDKDERKKCREAWEKWWKANEAKVDLAKLKTEEPLRGLTLTTEYDGDEGGRVWEFGPDGKVRWQIKNLSGPNDVQLLPGGRVLVAERNGNVVTERDREGKVLWEYKVQNNAIAAQRLPNGNTLVCTFNELYEVSPEKKVIHQHMDQNGFRHAIRIKNGNILYVSAAGNVVELSPEFKAVRTITPEAHAGGAGYWASVEPLPNGRLLVALGSSGKVVEIDGTGKIHWQVDSPNAVYATRLRNGNTLVSNFEGRVLLEYNRDGKEVGKIQLSGRPFVFRRY
jgi:HEAT repeat protein